MKIKVKALQRFFHGRQMADAGGEYEFTKGDAEQMEKNGLVEIVGESDPAETKMADPVENKMADAPDNKMERPTSNKRK